jgi:hypothetical protein
VGQPVLIVRCNMAAQNASTEVELMRENTNTLWMKLKSRLSFHFLLVHTPNTEVHPVLSLLVLIVTDMIKDVIVAKTL